MKRAGGTKRDTRILSLGPKTGAAKPVFELGFKADNDTKIYFSVDEDIDRGEGTGMPDLIQQGVWTFVAVTYDRDLANNRLCFYRGTESVAVTEVECRNYSARDIKRANAGRFVVGGPAKDSDRKNDTSFAGGVDNVFVYVGDVLPIAEIENLRND